IRVGLGLDLPAHRATERQRRRDVVAVVGLDLLGHRARLAAAGIRQLRLVDDHDRRRAAFTVRLLAAAAVTCCEDQRQRDRAGHATFDFSASPARNSADDTTWPSTFTSPFILKILPLRSGMTSMWS